MDVLSQFTHPNTDMNTSFLTLSPSRRAKKLKSLLHIFQQNARVMAVTFSVIAYGSSSYGFNSKNHGKLDDLDIFLVIPRDTDPEWLIMTVQMVFLTKINIKIEHLKAVISGTYDICRMYGQVRGIKIGFRIVCDDIFTSITTRKGSIVPVRNIASIGQSRIVTDKEWNFRLCKYVPIVYRNDYERLDGEDVLLVLQYCFPKRRHRLGPLARKLLVGTVVFDADNQKVARKLQDLWVLFIENSLRYNRDLTPLQIVNSIIRSDRFSISFKSKLCRLVTELVTHTKK